MDDLRSKIRAKGHTIRSLAKACDISEDFLHRILSGQQKCSGTTLRRICYESKGAVKWSDIFPPIHKEKDAQRRAS